MLPILVFATTGLLPPSKLASLPSRGVPAAQASRRSVVIGAGAAAAAAFSSPALAADPALYMPSAGSLAGSTILITGANTGLGLESAKRLAAAGARIIVTARTRDKVDGAVAEVARARSANKVVGVELDLADLSSVKTLPTRLESILGGPPAIDVLMNNAGVMAVPERLSTADGFEKTVGINHLGHFAMVAALLPSLQRAKDGFRIINVSSDAHRFVDRKMLLEALEARLDPPSYAAGGWGAYGLSKAANVLFTVELERRLEAAGTRGSAVTLHPGVVQTDLGRYIIGGVAGEDSHPTQDGPAPTGIGAFLKSNVLDKVVLPVQSGANTQVFLAAAADSGGDRSRRGGLYFDQMRPPIPSSHASFGTCPRL
jgi:NAD(P)-dependent dehydrogenase (short-subunit alcohol dehydrogenase family)